MLAGVKAEVSDVRADLDTDDGVADKTLTVLSLFSQTSQLLQLPVQAVLQHGFHLAGGGDVPPDVGRVEESHFTINVVLGGERPQVILRSTAESAAGLALNLPGLVPPGLDADPGHGVAAPAPPRLG